MTNLDMIRQLPAEDLIQFLSGMSCPPPRGGRCPDATCRDCWIMWLNEEAEGDAQS